MKRYENIRLAISILFFIISDAMKFILAKFYYTTKDFCTKKWEMSQL